MANLKFYRESIQMLLAQKAEHRSDAAVEAQTLFDTDRDHYQIIYIG